ncbi:MAG: carboxypeptidase regulatory-like domain-containing protein [Acidobacteria bacterium]|nr:carboxypeptidase regulatory-like domain-containing protein [Acidobacteriota bacterium]
MYSTLHVLVLSVFVSLAFSQTTQLLPVSTGSVEGIVVNAATREPLKKAWVTLERADGQGTSLGALTDATGRFALKDIESRHYRLSVERNGFVSQSYGQQVPESAGTVLTISPGQTLRDVQVALSPGAVISGHVYDDDAEAVVNASVTLMRFVYRGGRRQLQPRGFSRTYDLASIGSSAFRRGPTTLVRSSQVGGGRPLPPGRPRQAGAEAARRWVTRRLITPGQTIWDAPSLSN